MPAVTRKDDSCTGHGCFPPRATPSGSGNVHTNSKPTHRKGDGWLPHGCPNVPPHGSSTSAGSGTVFANSKNLARIGDPVACGSAIQSGSPNVFAGDSSESFFPPDFPFPAFTPFPAPTLRDAPALRPTQYVGPIDDPIVSNGEQLDVGEQEYEELSTGKCGEMPQRNPYDVASSALSSASWSERGRNPNIIALWEEIGYSASTGYSGGRYTAWCAVFVGATLKRAGCKYIQSAMARAYENYGIEVPWDDAQPGDIVVMFRNGIGSGSGHVGFATGKKTSTTIDILGGNQSDNLNVKTFNRGSRSASRGVLTIRRAVSCVDGQTPAPSAGTTNQIASSGAGGKVT